MCNSGNKRPMRILIVNYEYPPTGGGAATASQAIGKELVKSGHDVFVLTGRCKISPAFYEEDGIFVRRIPGLRKAPERSGFPEMASFLAAGLMFAPAIIRKNKIETAIIFFSLPCGPIGLVARWASGIPYVISLRGGDVPGAEPSLHFLHRILAPVRRAVLGKSIAIVANSEGLRRMAEAADPFRVRVIPNGVDSDFFKPEPARSTSSQFGRPLRILFVGRFQEQKNLPFLFQQFARLPAGTFELQLVGDGPQKNRLRELADQLGIAESITWHGWKPRSELPRIYHSAECLVNPSLYEGMPNAVLEAMACALPVIASNVPGNDELVVNGETGFLFALQDPDSLSRALLQMYDVDLRRRMGMGGRARARADFSWWKTAEAYLRLFSDSSPALRSLPR